MKCCTNKYVLNSLINVPPDPLAPATPDFYVYEVGIDYTGFGGANFVAEITIDGTTYSWTNNPQVGGGNIGGAVSDGISIAQSLVAAFGATAIDPNTWYAWGGNDRGGVYSFGGIVTSEPHTIKIAYDEDLGGPYVEAQFVERTAVQNLCATHTGVAAVDTLDTYTFLTPVNTGGTMSVQVTSTSFLTIDNIEFDILTVPQGFIQGLGTLVPSYTIVQNGGTYDITFTNFFMNLTDVLTDNGSFSPTSC